jgi:hypothetical protein
MFLSSLNSEKVSIRLTFSIAVTYTFI